MCWPGCISFFCTLAAVVRVQAAGGAVGLSSTLSDKNNEFMS